MILGAEVIDWLPLLFWSLGGVFALLAVYSFGANDEEVFVPMAALAALCGLAGMFGAFHANDQLRGLTKRNTTEFSHRNYIVKSVDANDIKIVAGSCVLPLKVRKDIYGKKQLVIGLANGNVAIVDHSFVDYVAASKICRSSS